MALKILELHHHAVCVDKALIDKTRSFYVDVMGLSSEHFDPKQPEVPVYYLDLPNDTQIHLMATNGVPSKISQGAGKDPLSPHVAMAVPDVVEAEKELARLGIDYWKLENVVRPNLTAIFFRDPAGNILEVHQIGLCRCKRTPSPAALPHR